MGAAPLVGAVPVPEVLEGPVVVVVWIVVWEERVLVVDRLPEGVDEMVGALVMVEVLLRVALVVEEVSTAPPTIWNGKPHW